MKRLFFKEEGGQAMVELALVLPILLILFMGVIEFGRIYQTYLVITNASREGARVAILGGSDTDITSRVQLTTDGLDQASVQTNIALVPTPDNPAPASRTSGTMVSVEVSYKIPLAFPPFDTFLPNPLPVTSKTVMRVE